MKNIFVLWLLGSMLFHVVYAVYVPTNADEEIVSALKTKVSQIYQKDSTKIDHIAFQLSLLLRSFEVGTRNHYIIDALQKHILSLEEQDVLAQDKELSVVVTSESVEDGTGTGGEKAVSHQALDESGDHGDNSDLLMRMIESGYIQGNPDATLTVIEFADFQCPVCQRFVDEHIVESLLERFDGKVNSVFAHFPLKGHEFAIDAAMAAECVGQQGGASLFHRYKDELYVLGLDEQADIYDASNFLDDSLDVNQLRECVEENRFAVKVQRNYMIGKQVGVRSTPTIILYDTMTGVYKIIRGAVSVDTLERVIKERKPDF